MRAHDSRSPRFRRHRGPGRHRNPPPSGRRRDEGLGLDAPVRGLGRPRGDFEPRLRYAAPQGVERLADGRGDPARRGDRRAQADARARSRGDRGAVHRRGPRAGAADRGRARAHRDRDASRRPRACRRRLSRMACAAVRGRLRRRRCGGGAGARRPRAGRSARQPPENHAREGAEGAGASGRRTDAAVAGRPAHRDPPGRARSRRSPPNRLT